MHTQDTHRTTPSTSSRTRTIVRGYLALILATMAFWGALLAAFPRPTIFTIVCTAFILTIIVCRIVPSRRDAGSAVPRTAESAEHQTPR